MADNYKDFRKHSGHNSNAVVALSLLLHAGLIAFFIIGSGPAVHNGSDKTDNIISYVLVKKPKTRDITQKPPSPRPEPIGIVAKTPLQIESLGAVVHNDATPNNNSEPKAKSKEALHVRKNNKLTENPTSSKLQALDWAKSKNPLIQIQKPYNNERSPQDLTGKNIGFYTNGAVHQQAYEDMLQQEIKTYNKLKNSPTIDTIGTLDTTLQVTTLKPKVIRCERSVSSTLVVLSKFTGGTVQCQQHDIQSFIDQRLDNKE